MNDQAGNILSDVLARANERIKELEAQLANPDLSTIVWPVCKLDDVKDGEWYWCKYAGVPWYPCVFSAQKFYHPIEIRGPIQMPKGSPTAPA